MIFRVEISSSETGVSWHTTALGSQIGRILSSPPAAAIPNFLNSFSVGSG